MNILFWVKKSYEQVMNILSTSYEHTKPFGTKEIRSYEHVMAYLLLLLLYK